MCCCRAGDLDAKDTRHLAQRFDHITGGAIMSAKEGDSEIPVIILEKQRNKPEKLPVISPRHESDEANYRWFPSVAKNNGSSLDAAASFETLHPSFAKRWASSPSSDTATRSGCLNGDNNSETNKKCLATSTSSNSNNNNSSSIPNNKLADNNNGPVFSHAEAAAAAAAASTMPGSTLNGEAYTKGAAGGVVPLNGHARATAASSQLLFLVRHGQTDMNKAGKLQGRGVNAHLNDAGLSQAEGLGRFVRNVPFDTVTASSLHRAHETAMRIAELNVKCVERAQENGMPTMATMPTGGAASSSCPPAEYFCCGDKAQVRVRNFEGLDELSWGELEGQNSAAEPWVSKLASLKAAWDEGNFDRAAKGGESLLEVQARASEALEACLDGGHDTNLIVSHGRTLRILLLSLSGLGLDQMTNVGKIPNAGLYIIEARRSSPGAARTYRLLKPCDVD